MTGEAQQREKKTSLDRLLETRNLPAKSARLAILRQLAKAIDDASGTAGLSGDLTPQNISVSSDFSDPEIVITLTGAGAVFVPEEELTTDGTIPEAAFYLSPERILGTSTDLRSYEFSLGVIAYELVCGAKPFNAPNLQQLFYRVCAERAVPAGEADRTLTPAVSAVIDRALSKDRDQRYSDCTTFIDALGAALADCPGWTDRAHHRGASPAPGVLASGAYGASPTRVRRRYADEPEDERWIGQLGSRQRSSRQRYGLWAALCLAAVGLLIFAARYKLEPNVPVQILDTQAGPAAPPPETAPVDPLKSNPQAGQTAPSSVSKAAHADRNPTPATQQERAFSPLISEVEFLTDPPSAKVVVDGDPARGCTTPCSLSLPAGRHTLSTTRDGFNRAQRIFSLPQDKSLFIALNRQAGTLLVTSTPSGLAILVDGQNYGQTPATLHLAPGRHQLVVINGASRHGETVDVEADAIQAKAINW